jgi:hypothetical protein
MLILYTKTNKLLSKKYNGFQSLYIKRISSTKELMATLHNKGLFIPIWNALKCISYLSKESSRSSYICVTGMYFIDALKF